MQQADTSGWVCMQAARTHVGLARSLSCSVCNLSGVPLVYRVRHSACMQVSLCANVGMRLRGAGLYGMRTPAWWTFAICSKSLLRCRMPREKKRLEHGHMATTAPVYRNSPYYTARHGKAVQGKAATTQRLSAAHIIVRPCPCPRLFAPLICTGAHKERKHPCRQVACSSQRYQPSLHAFVPASHSLLWEIWKQTAFPNCP